LLKVSQCFADTIYFIGIAGTFLRVLQERPKRSLQDSPKDSRWNAEQSLHNAVGPCLGTISALSPILKKKGYNYVRSEIPASLRLKSGFSIDHKSVKRFVASNIVIASTSIALIMGIADSIQLVDRWPFSQQLLGSTSS
jgi:hypothetical protein